MKEAEEILRETVSKDCIWEEMNHLTNTPIDLVVKAMEIYKNQALTIPVVNHQRELVCEHKFGEEYTSIGGTMRLRMCEKCEEVQTCG